MKLVTRCYIVIGLFLVAMPSIAQKRALTSPFKYLKPYINTDSKIDDRKSPYLWEVFVDRDGVPVYKEKNLRNTDDSYQVRFMDKYIVADETEDALLLFKDPNVDSVNFSPDAVEIGWVKKNNLVLWNKFLWGENRTKLLALTYWERFTSRSAFNTPNVFGDLPENDSRYYIFNVVKQDPAVGETLISLRTFNHRNPNQFCWVKDDALMFINDRNGYIPNRELILDYGADNPAIYETSMGAQRRDLNKIEYYIDSLRADEGFFDLKTSTEKNIKKVTWVDEGSFREGYITYNPRDMEQGRFKKGILLNRQEFSVMKSTVEVLVGSRTKEEYKTNWMKLFENYNMTFYENMGQYQLFQELVQTKFNYEPKSDGATVNEIAFMSYNKFQELKQELFRTLEGLIRAESDSDYPYNFAPFAFPHYWIPLEILPLQVFETEYASDMSSNSQLSADGWTFESDSKTFETFHIYYVDNSHDYQNSFELKDQTIRDFYLGAARVGSSNPYQGSFIFYSNSRSPATGSGEKFTEDVAGMMRESVASRPNRRIDKKQIRSHLYAKNIIKVDQLKIHFYIGENFTKEAMQGNRWLLEEMASELHSELQALSTEVILHVLSQPTDDRAYIDQLNNDVPPGMVYKISTIQPK